MPRAVLGCRQLSLGQVSVCMRLSLLQGCAKPIYLMYS